MLVTKVKKRSSIQENRVAKELKGKTVMASGALWQCKADVRTDNLLVECKTTNKDYYPLKLSTWLKIKEEATKDGIRVPVMCIDVKTPLGRESFAVFDLDNLPDYYKSVYSSVDTYLDKASIRINSGLFTLSQTDMVFAHFITRINRGTNKPYAVVVTLWEIAKEILNGGNE